MDTLTRKTLWEVLALLKDQSSSVLITTHSIDETEALSNRITIMFKEVIKHVGTSSSLREDLGNLLKYKLTTPIKTSKIARIKEMLVEFSQTEIIQNDMVASCMQQ